MSYARIITMFRIKFKRGEPIITSEGDRRYSDPMLKTCLLCHGVSKEQINKRVGLFRLLSRKKFGRVIAAEACRQSKYIVISVDRLLTIAL